MYLGSTYQMYLTMNYKAVSGTQGLLKSLLLQESSLSSNSQEKPQTWLVLFRLRLCKMPLYLCKIVQFTLYCDLECVTSHRKPSSRFGTLHKFLEKFYLKVWHWFIILITTLYWHGPSGKWIGAGVTKLGKLETYRLYYIRHEGFRT